VFKPAKSRAVPLETEATRLVRRGLQAGNNRSHSATASELSERLRADEIPFDREVLTVTLRQMFRDGRLRQDPDDRLVALPGKCLRLLSGVEYLPKRRRLGWLGGRLRLVMVALIWLLVQRLSGA
jgi:hypothetical protein